MNLTCTSENKVSSIGFIFILISTITYCLTPFLKKAIGMKFLWTLTALLQFGAFVTFYFVQNINLALFIAMVYGIAGTQNAFSFTFLT